MKSSHDTYTGLANRPYPPDWAPAVTRHTADLNIMQQMVDSKVTKVEVEWDVSSVSKFS